eukprot:COSAG01_NODE_3584_length_5909_cov_6.177281_1_plen_369_part_00
MRFEQQVGSSIIVTCTSPRCKHAKGFVCRHACVVGAHDFPMCGKLIQRDNGAWWLRNMVRKEYHCATIRDLAAMVTPTMSPPIPNDTAGPQIRMPVMRAENRSDLKPGRYRAFHESSDKGRAPPKRKERDLVAEAARDLVMELDESDACLAVVYNQTTVAKFADGSATKGRARPVRVIRAGETREAQPRLTATVHCYLSNRVTDLLVEHISFAQTITEHTARVTAITGKWFHPNEPANPQTRASADIVMDRTHQSLPPMNPDAARGLIEQASVGQYLDLATAVATICTSSTTLPVQDVRVQPYYDGCTHYGWQQLYDTAVSKLYDCTRTVSRTILAWYSRSAICTPKTRPPNISGGDPEPDKSSCAFG